MKKNLTKDQLAAINAKSHGLKGKPSSKFLRDLNSGVKSQDMKVTNVRMFTSGKKPHSEIVFRNGESIKVREHKDPQTAVRHARMLLLNRC